MVKNWGGAGDHRHRWGDGHWYPCRVPLLHPETWGRPNNDSLGRGSSVRVDTRLQGQTSRCRDHAGGRDCHRSHGLPSYNRGIDGRDWKRGR